jgi:hypothetical protein
MQVTIWPRGSKRTYEATSADANTPITDVGELLSVEFSTRMERTQDSAFGGHDLARWRIQAFGNFLGGMFRPGDHVRISTNGGVAWEGEFSETVPQGDGTFEMNARGYAYNFGEYDSMYFKVQLGQDELRPTHRLVGGLWPTLPVGDGPYFGLEYALVHLGLPIAQFVGTVSGDDWKDVEAAPEPTKLQPVLTGLTTADGNRWAVWGRTLVIDTDPTTPTWQYAAPDAVVGMADTDYRTRVGVWVDIGGTEWTWWGIDEEGLTRFDEFTEVVDYRTIGGDQALADSLIEQVKGRFLFSGSITIGPEDGLSTPTGGKVPIAFPRAGQMLLVPGMRTSQGSLMPDGMNQFIIGRTEYRWSLEGEESLTITPQGAAPRDVATLLKPPGGPGEQLQAGAA